jgi:hypothetical protein
MKVVGVVAFVAVSLWGGGFASAQSFESEVAPLVETSCLQCHGARTVTPLNLSQLGFDLTDAETVRAWTKVYERVEKGEMPPASARRPDTAVVETALGSLKAALVDANRTARGGQRTPLRRLTRLEYGYTLEDLLGIDPAVASNLAQELPAEADSGGFDTVAANQSMSPLHVRAYLEVADRALDAALLMGPRPETERHQRFYAQSPYLYGIANARALGLGSILQLDDAYVMFFDFTSTYTFHSDSEGIRVTEPGRYNVAVEAYAYQGTSPVNLMVYQGKKAGVVASLDNLIGSFDFEGETPRTVEMSAYLGPGELIGMSIADLDVPGYDPADVASGKLTNQTILAGRDPSEGYADVIKDFPGEGVAIKSLTIEGPLYEMWPPASTRTLLTGMTFDDVGHVQLTKAPYEHVVDVVGTFATRAFRRPLEPSELEAYASLARPLLAEGRPFLDALRVSLRAVLSAPPFLYHGGEPGALDDYALATRLAYFLWRSMPDDELLAVAADGTLTDRAVLTAQVDRMLDDPKNARFIKDFAGQAFRLYELKATLPDAGLYPEYDDRLGQAMAEETELFLAELVAEDLGIDHLVTADFTFLNRRLAEHYGVADVTGQEMRRVALPTDSPRGGLLTHASVLKVTANGTTTSPIPRGNFVLSNLLGRPAPPPPPGVAGLEPDTRGTTTIREQLDAHRNNAVCASCHRTIDPPGFALESFDPIGGFREQYRVTGGSCQPDFGTPFHACPPTDGPSVDTSGMTPTGKAFAGITEYKTLLLDEELDAMARHLTSQLLVYGTGAETGFADRDTVLSINASLSDRGYPVRSVIHEVIQSDLFRSR